MQFLMVPFVPEMPPPPVVAELLTTVQLLRSLAQVPPPELPVTRQLLSVDSPAPPEIQPLIIQPSRVHRYTPLELLLKVQFFMMAEDATIELLKKVHDQQVP